VVVDRPREDDPAVKIKEVLDVFSRRKREPQVRLRPLPKAFRTRIVMRFCDFFAGTDRRDDSIRPENHIDEFWPQVQRHLCYLVGTPRLAVGSAGYQEDVLYFLESCTDDHFLSFIEYAFRVDFYWRCCSDENVLVEEVNHLLDSDDLPYALTPFLYEEKWGTFLHGKEGMVRERIAFPRVILKEQEIPYREAVAPAIALLAEKGFSSANREFLDALAEYRKGRYGDSLTKCGSAFESTMKLVCDKRKWKYSPTDTAAPLLKTIVGNSGLDSFFEQPLLIVATLRNRLSTAHGAGAAPRSVSQHQARYAINATAAGILLLVEHCA
jgi:Abortive infection C-terminus